MTVREEHSDPCVTNEGITNGNTSNGIVPSDKPTSAWPRENKPDLLGMFPEELEVLMKAYGEPAYRARQIFPLLHRGMAPEQMQVLPLRLRTRLREDTVYTQPAVARKLVSRIDGTVKYLLRLRDGACIESVLMRYRHGNTLCLSSQVGCRMGCRFCASTIGGKERDLAASELLGQITAVERDSGERISNLVLMGIGEPLDNFDNVVRFLHLVNRPEGLCIGYRHISLSTCGLADRIRDLAAQDLPITLSVSLHASDDATRSAIMPVNRRYCLSELMSACRAYYLQTGRRISFEYTLIAGRNDTPADADALSDLLHRAFAGTGAPLHVNLIRVNAVAETDCRRGSRESVAAFAERLTRAGVVATVRRRLGADVNAACGQLRRHAMMPEKASFVPGAERQYPDTEKGGRAEAGKAEERKDVKPPVHRRRAFRSNARPDRDADVRSQESEKNREENDRRAENRKTE